ncbi:CBS domain protein [Plasticicumulans lactativorans]|uniref:CBS domain protein n=1 Tax=Plasticicumulans lactativorans TaxID=1133106 RepID=A0A4R2KZV7_9GAMM|nr:CBS domain-containing protein [Plasticicumulans lactativorans]TCO80261.1 CBS domain protein [Plasticicumulans lactativorans]
MHLRLIRSIVEQQKIVTASPQITVSEAARLMKQNRVGAVMITEAGCLIGIFTERDALFRVLAEGRDGQATVLAEVMTPNPHTIGPDKPLGHALHMMYESGFRHVPVVEDGRPLGMVSARDALGPELQQFEVELQQREHLGEIL